ncbi:hypothetical protein ACFP3Q_16085 [Nocardioides sp. GCM10027113]|uniref:hypothetical protein n=1 Tax=unclassified Nocardioides TaxID=2615069 RepID=UPI00360EC477
MLSVALAMIIVLAVCGLVVTYVAFPHRGEEVPGAPWLGDALSRGVERLPVLADRDLSAAQPVEVGAGGLGADLDAGLRERVADRR